MAREEVIPQSRTYAHRINTLGHAHAHTHTRTPYIQTLAHTHARTVTPTRTGGTPPGRVSGLNSHFYSVQGGRPLRGDSVFGRFDPEGEASPSRLSRRPSRLSRRLSAAPRLTATHRNSPQLTVRRHARSRLQKKPAAAAVPDGRLRGQRFR